MIIEPIFKWNLEDERMSASYRTWGTFVVHVDGELFWGSEEFGWAWYDLLNWLIQAWPYLNVKVEGFSEDEEQAWQAAFYESTQKKRDAFTTYDKDEEALWWFNQAHDFKYSLAGASLPSLFVWRDDENGYFRTESNTLTVPVEQWEQFLRDTATAIAEQLKDCVDNPMSIHLLKGYQQVIAEEVNYRN